MANKIDYGKTATTEIIDDEGSTKTTEIKVHKNVQTRPRKVYYEIRHRTDKTNIAKIQEIAQDLLADITKIDAFIKLERTTYGEQDGYFHLVECYTVLEV